MQRITRSAALVGAVLVLLGLTGCGSDDNAAPEGPCTTVTGDSYTLVAQNVRWNTYCLQVQAGQAVTFTVQNTESVEHNLHILDTGQDLQTPLEAGPVVHTLDVTINQRGTYEYTCDIHQATMTGTLRVT